MAVLMRGHGNGSGPETTREGLGLAITASIVERIGATIALLDRPDGERGLRARVVFPVGAPPQ